MSLSQSGTAVSADNLRLQEFVDEVFESSAGPNNVVGPAHI